MKNRLIAFLLIVLTLIGTIMLPVSAETQQEFVTATEYAVKNKDGDGKPYGEVVKKITDEIAAGYTELYAQTEKYQLFCNKYTGEVYLRDRATGQYLTTNPVNVGTAQQEDKLSQVWLSYRTYEAGSAKVNYNSFTMAAKKGQISVSRIRGGIRVEYTMGDVTSRYLAPQAILEEDYLAHILEPYQQHIMDILNYEFMRTRFSTFVKLPELDENGDPIPAYDEDNNLIHYDDEAIKVYKRLNDLVVKDDPKEFKADIDDILGVPLALDSKRNENVNSRFRYDWKVARNKVIADLASTDPAVVAAAEELRDEMLEQIRLLKPAQELPLPGESSVAKWLNDVYKDFGNFTASYENVVDLNKYYNEDGTPKSEFADQIAQLKKTYAVLDYDLEPGESYPKIRTLNFQRGEGVSEATTIRDFQKVQKYFTDSIEDYTLASMLLDEEKVGFEPVIYDNPLFRCALEYTLDDTGFTVDIPASSIIFDESKYELTDLSFLRYFGAGSTDTSAANDGYVFYPDGSGALIYNNTMPSSAVLNQPIYSYDYAYANLTLKDAGESLSSSQPIRLPVFGAVNRVQTGVSEDGKKPVYGNEHVGYLAVITEGESLARIYTKVLDDGGAYVGTYASYTFRATDNYSIGRLKKGSTVSISSDFKYTGFYTQKYIMLTDAALNETLGPDNGKYRADYVGMADAYRDYLFGKGDLTSLAEDKLESRLPLYIESYATVKTVESVLSFPVEVDKPLSSFKDIRTIGDELREAGVSNVKFRLMGYYNDGYKGYYPNRIKWMKEVGGKKGFKALMNYVAEHADEGFEVFTDVDLLYNYRPGKIGSISKRKTSVRSMDDRYVRKSMYSTIYRTSMTYVGFLISASKLSSLFAKFDKKFSKFNSLSISLANLAADLSSNFNEDDFFTREQAKVMIADVMKEATERYSVMAQGGNVYTLPYVDYLLNAPVDGSHYNYVSRTIPFFGMVMHGSLQYAGTVFNEAGNPDYELLRDIESGAAMYVILVYRNTDLMKEDYNELYKHYSANYQIWHDDLIDFYDVLDYAIGDLQNWRLSDHRFLTAERLAQESEREEDEKTLEEEYLQLLTRQYEDGLTERNRLLRYLWFIDIADTDAKRNTRIKTLAQGMLTGRTYGEEAKNKIVEVIEAIRGDYDPGTEDKDIAPDALKKLIDPADPYYAYSTAGGQKVKITVDVNAILADAEAQLNAAPSDWLREQVEALKASVEYDGADGVLDLTVSGVDNYATKTKNSFVTDSEADDPAYKKTAYTISDGSVVLVTYTNGTDTVRFLLNFSIFTVNVRYNGQIYTLGKYDFVRLDPRADGTTDPRTR